MGTPFCFTTATGSLTVECEPPVTARGLAPAARQRGRIDDVIEEGSLIVHDTEAFRLARFRQNTVCLVSFGKPLAIRRVKIECKKSTNNPGIKEFNYIQ